MKVKDLIEALQGYDPEMEVFHLNVSGCPAGDPDELDDPKLKIEKVYYHKAFNNFYTLRSLVENKRESVESFDVLTINPDWY